MRPLIDLGIRTYRPCRRGASFPNSLNVIFLCGCWMRVHPIEWDHGSYCVEFSQSCGPGHHEMMAEMIYELALPPAMFDFGIAWVRDVDLPDSEMGCCPYTLVRFYCGCEWFLDHYASTAVSSPGCMRHSENDGVNAQIRFTFAQEDEEALEE